MVASKNASSSPTFIVGMNGSGTTLILDLLNNHPMLYGFPRETRLLPYYIKRLHKYGDLSIDGNYLRLWNDIISIKQFTLENGNHPLQVPDNWREFPRSLASIFDYVMKYFAAKEGKQRWCEKTPMHVLHIKELNNIFPHAKFIHVIRDGRDCAASFYRRWLYRPERTIYRWKRAVQIGHIQGSALNENYIEVHYEELITYPEKWLQIICAFLEVPFEKCVLYPSRKRGFTGSREEIIKGDIQKWKNCFVKKKLVSLENISGKVLNEFGYDTIKPNSDNNPSRFLLGYWFFIDSLRRTLNVIWDGLRKKDSKINWSARWAIITTAVKQFYTNRF